MEEQITMRGVGISFGGAQALRDLTFSVGRGEIFGFLGPSGAGKTTTIKLLTRQLTADEGEIGVFGEPVEKLAGGAFRRIGVLSDNSGVYERLTVQQNLELLAQLRGVGKARVQELIEAVGLADARGKTAKKLSRGMRQRVMLAGAVLHRPQLLFLDEPTASLDPGTTAGIHALLRQLNAQGTTIFLTTHDMEEADKLCGRVAFLHHGHIEECGAPEELKLKYAKNEIVALLADGRRVSAEKTAEGLDRIRRAAGSCAILSVHSQEPDLEELFLQVTGRKLA